MNRLNIIRIACRAQKWTAAVILIAALFPISAHAQITPANVGRFAYIEQKIGVQAPMETPFVDESGQPVHLGDFFHKQPVILVMIYFGCPDLCPVTLNHLTEGLNGIGMESGRDFQIVTVSFDPTDRPAMAASLRQRYLRGYKFHGTPQATAGWHFLTGKQPAIDALTNAIGFHFLRDATHNRYAHATGLMILSPDGRMSHYFFGTDFSPADLSASLIDAAAGRSTKVDQPEQQYCFLYDPRDAKYGRIISHILQTCGTIWALLLIGYIGHKLLQDARTSRTQSAVSVDSDDAFDEWNNDAEEQ